MSERAWTPGPWRTRAELDHMTVHRESGLLIADCGPLVPSPLDSDERRANARLTAAAPDLYEALLDLAARYDLYFGGGKHAGETDAALLKQARAALARAEGRS